MAKTVTVHKISTTASVTASTSHATADSYVVTANGDLIVLDQNNAVVATYPRGTWTTARSGATA